MSKKLILSYIFFTALISNVFGQLHPNLIGNAADLGNDCYLITPDLNNQSGAIWYENAIDFSADFEIVFDAYFGTNDADGADGMALVFKPSMDPELGGLGGGLGYAGINPSLALEFDTWQNSSDPVADHIGLMANGNPNHGSGLAITEFPNLENGETYEIKFSWNAASKTILITKDCVEIISYTGDIVNLTLDGNNTAYFGFTGSTGGARNEQRICFKHISFVESLSDLNMCIGDTINSVDATFSGATNYSWTPTTGVSDPTIPNPIFSPATPTTYQVVITGTCGNVYTEDFTINVHDYPIVITPTQLIQCDDDDLLTLGFSPFNLTEANHEISTNAINETFTYYTTQTAATIGDIASPYYIIDPTTFVNSSVSTDVVWARVESLSGCASISEIQLNVSTTAIPSNLLITFSQCDDFLDVDGNDSTDNDDMDGIASFDFSNITATDLGLTLPGQSGLTPRYYRNEADALAEINEINNTSNYRNIGYPGTQYIYVRIDSDIANDCLGLGAHVLLNVETLPLANPVTIARQCDYDLSDTIISFPFDTSQLETNILNGQSLADVTISYFDAIGTPLHYLDGTLVQSPIQATYLTESQEITIRVTNNSTQGPDGPCSAETNLKFIVDEQPVIANTIAPQVFCDIGNDFTYENDGLNEFDTSSFSSTILGAQSTRMNIVYDYIDENGSQLINSPTLPNPLISNNQTITARVTNPDNNSCYASTSIELIVNPLPLFTVNSPRIVCSSDPTFSIQLEPLEDNIAEVFNYEWHWTSLDGVTKNQFISNDREITVTSPGIYSITLTKTNGTGCSKTQDIFVDASELAIISQNDVTIVDISKNNSLTIDTTNLGSGEYEYAVKEENSSFIVYQDEPYFDNLTPGFYTVYIKDKICGTTTLNVSVIGHAKYFTPNGDGNNDKWQIKGLSSNSQPNSVILIYDRYGKLLKQLSARNDGWDGTYNGAVLPTDDYWFRVALEDGRVFSGHFTLKQ